MLDAFSFVLSEVFFDLADLLALLLVERDADRGRLAR